MRKNYLLFLIVIGLITLSVYSTYAMFTASIDTGNIVNLTSSTLEVDSKIIEYEILTLNAKETKTIKFTVTNSTTSLKYYGVWYEMIEPTSITDGIQVSKSPDTTSDTFGSLSSNSSTEVLLVVANDTESSLILNIGVAYSDTNSLDLPTDRYLITEEYEELVDPRTSEQMIEHLGLTSLVKTGTPTFSKVATTDEGIYTAEDDLGTSYYFRGASQNNYVYFAGLYWRIVRINGDGTIRLIYDGKTKHQNGESSTDRQIQTAAYNEVFNDNTYVGYMYGASGQSTYAKTHANTNPSTIKGVVDTWYATNIANTEYNQYVADAIYCNDRKAGSSGDGIGTNYTFYGVYDRLIATTPSPTLKCSQENDRFTQSRELGNGALATTHPVALITADEVAMGGGKFASSYQNKKYYLYIGQDYWTMSPYNVTTGYANLWFVTSTGYIGGGGAVTKMGVRPVISLKSHINFSGDGSYDTPFTIAS